MRNYFHAQNFIEIDMPLLVRGTTPDPEIESFAVGDRYLVTSTEYQIKRMEAGGFERLYTLTQNFRPGDRSRYRNPEFTMLEWARVGVTLTEIEADVENFTRAAAAALGLGDVLTYQGHRIDLSPPWDRLTIRDAARKITGVSLPDFSPASLRTAIQAAGLSLSDAEDDDTLFLFTVLLDHLQAHLGFDKPVFLQEWPDMLTSSAPASAPGLTARSELFIAGIELSDGFPTLTDAAQQRRNFARAAATRAARGKATVTLDDAYLKTMNEGLPPGAGMALGLDRLVMLLTDCAQIDDVLAFSWDEL